MSVVVVMARASPDVPASASAAGLRFCVLPAIDSGFDPILSRSRVIPIPPILAGACTVLVVDAAGEATAVPWANNTMTIAKALDCDLKPAAANPLKSRTDFY